jgi:hypothetical protein
LIVFCNDNRKLTPSFNALLRLCFFFFSVEGKKGMMGVAVGALVCACW